MRTLVATVVVIVGGLMLSWAALVVETVRRQPSGMFVE